MLYEYINNSNIYLTEIMYKRYYWINCQTKLYINVYEGLMFKNDLDYLMVIHISQLSFKICIISSTS